jgi:CRISPR-associated protein Csb2
MFLGLPFVEAPDADGHLLGFAVSIPRGIDESVRAAVYRSLVGVSELRHSKLGKVRLRRTELDPRWGTDPDRWARPSTRWVTAYPAVLDRFVRGDEQITPTIARMCERVGLPTSAHIDWSTAPFISGPDRLSPHHTVRRPGDSVHKFVHVRLTFRRAVAGPIVIGHMRHFGLGLMLPEPARPPESLGGEAHR